MNTLFRTLEKLLILTIVQLAGFSTLFSQEIHSKLIIPPVNFESDHRWVMVPDDADDAAINAMIRNEVEALIESKDQPTKYNDALNVFDNWMDEKDRLSNIWEQRALELGTKLRNQVAEVSRLRQESIALHNNAMVAKTKLDALNQAIKNDSLSIKRYADERDFLKKNLEDQLENVNYIVVALGKRKQGINDKASDVREQIGNTMIAEAVHEVNGTQVWSETVVKESKLIQSYIKTTESGYTQVLDSYSNNFAKLSSDNTTIMYLVQAIKVAPFSSKQSKEKRSGKTDESTSAYVVNSQNLDQIWDKENLTNDFSKEQIKRFIQRRIEQAEEHNKQIDSKIRKINQVYIDRNAEIDSEVTDLTNRINNSILLLKEYQNDYNVKRIESTEYVSKYLTPALDTLNSIDRGYRRHLNLRILFADKTDQGWVQEKIIDIYLSTASNTFNKLSEFKETEYSQSYFSVNYQLESYSESVLSYKPRIRAFTVLYLAKKELSTDVSYEACLGYQLELTSDDYNPEDYVIEFSSDKKSLFNGKILYYGGAAVAAGTAAYFLMNENEEGKETGNIQINVPKRP